MSKKIISYINKDIENALNAYKLSKGISKSIAISGLLFLSLKDKGMLTIEAQKNTEKYIAYVSANSEFLLRNSAYSQYHDDRMKLGRILATWSKSKKEQKNFARLSIGSLVKKYENFYLESVTKDHKDELEEMKACMTNIVFLERYIGAVIEEFIVFTRIERELKKRKGQ